MKREISALVAGALFGGGLAAAGMTDPLRVLAFLDLFGAWDPTLVYVMGAAVAVTLLTFRFVLRRPAPLFDEHFHVPTRRDLDARLVAGSLMFGVGWGLYGYCPGPAIGALVYAHGETLLFVGAMLAGVFAEYGWRKLRGIG
jgi:uncharacterized membrane protein YedE/YeeE